MALDAASPSGGTILAALVSTCSALIYSADGLTHMPTGHTTIAAGPIITTCPRITTIHSFTDGHIARGQGRFITVGAGSAIPGIEAMDITSPPTPFISAPRSG